MKSTRLAVPANPDGTSQRRDFAFAIPDINPRPLRLGSAWKRGATALCMCAIALSAPASALNLAWDPNPEPDIDCYELSYGTSSGVYSTVIDAGPNTSVSVTGLVEGTTYYFVVNACNQVGLKSDPSAEITYQVPVTPPPPGAVIPRSGWALKYVDCEETNGYPASYAFDGNPNTFWHTTWRTAAPPPPHEIQIDLGAVYPIQGFRYLPRQDNYLVGNIAQFEFYVSLDGSHWGNPVASGTFANTNAEKEVLFTTGNARYVRLRSLTLADGGACNIAELNILQGQAAIVPPNQAPVAVSSSVATAEDTQLAIVLAASDPDGTALTYAVVAQPAHGTLSGSAPNVTYTPVSNYHGPDSFTFKANDGTIDSAAATVSLTVTAVNDAPVFAADPINLNATEDAAFAGQLAASDVDAGDNLTFTKISGPAWLTVSSTGSLGGTPTNAEVGANAFVVRVTDGAGAIDAAALNITVVNLNDAPVFAIDPILAASGKVSVAYTGQTLAGLATDVDAGDSLTYSKVSGPAWLAVAANGALSGTPTTDSSELNTFIVRATDSSSATDEAELRITVVGLPLPWVTGDIGTGMLASSASCSAGTFTQAGSGKFGGTSDKFCFTYQTLSGDGEIIAKVSSLQNTGTSSRVGVMIRDSLATNSRQVFMGLTSTNAYRWVRRTSTGGSNSTTSSSTGTVPNTWVRLVRSGSTITASKSVNGTLWTTVGSTTVTMATNCYIGLAVTSGSSTTLNTSQFSNVSVTP